MYEEILEPGIILWDKEQSTKIIVKSEKIKKLIISNNNFRNNQNYVLSYEDLNKILWVYNHSRGSRWSTFNNFYVFLRYKLYLYFVIYIYIFTTFLLYDFLFKKRL